MHGLYLRIDVFRSGEEWNGARRFEMWKEEGLAVFFVQQKSPISFINYFLILVLEKASLCS